MKLLGRDRPPSCIERMSVHFGAASAHQGGEVNGQRLRSIAKAVSPAVVSDVPIVGVSGVEPTRRNASWGILWLPFWQNELSW